MQLSENWQERFYKIYERARLREIARLDAISGLVDPFARDPHRLGALKALVRKIVDDSNGLTNAQSLALSNELMDAAAEVDRRRN